MKNTLLLLTIITTLTGCAQTGARRAIPADTLSEKFLTDEWLGTAVLNDSEYLAIPYSLKTVDSLTRAHIGMLIPFRRELDPNGKDTMVPTWMIDGYWSGTWALKNDSLIFIDDDYIIGRVASGVRIISHDKIELKRSCIDHATGKKADQYELMERH